MPDYNRAQKKATKQRINENDYYRDVHFFVSTSIKYCMKFPEQLLTMYVYPVEEKVKRIYVLTARANGIYVNPKASDYIEAIKKRIEVLEDILGVFDELDGDFGFLFDAVETVNDTFYDIKAMMKEALKELNAEIIEEQQNNEAQSGDLGNVPEPELVLRPKILFPPKVYVTCPQSGKREVAFRFTEKNKSAWMDAENKAITCISRRLASDRSIVKKIAAPSTVASS